MFLFSSIFLYFHLLKLLKLRPLLKHEIVEFTESVKISFARIVGSDPKCMHWKGLEDNLEENYSLMNYFALFCGPLIVKCMKSLNGRSFTHLHIV